jgi:molecular chaperone DnaJ
VPDVSPDLDALFGDLFGQFFSGTFAANLSVDLALTDAEAASGVTRDVTFQRQRACATCEGRGSGDPTAVAAPCAACNATGKREVTQGFFKVQTTCAACRGVGTTIKNPCGPCTGTGRVSTPATVTVVVPAGFEHGKLLTIANEGSLGADGTLGQLFVYVLVGGRPDPRAEAFAAAAAMPVPLPAAEVHRPPMPTWQVAAIGIVVLAMLAALLLAR